MRKVTIDPITRLEGHGRIDIFLDDKGDVANTYFVIPELRGFEKFAEGRPVEEMPRITSRICGVCPEAHMMASAKACDAVYGVELTSAAKKIREMQYNAFYLGDHATHFYALGGPDFVMGPDADPAVRNIIGVIGKVGLEIGGAVIRLRRECHEVAMMLGGKPVHPVNAIPGGVSKAINNDMHTRMKEIADFGLEAAKLTVKIFNDIVLANKQYVDIILSEPYQLVCYNIGLVDEKNRTNFYDGKARVTGPDGKEHAKYAPHEYLDYIAEHVEPWNYLKFPYLKKIGWKGLVEGIDSGVYRASPLSRCNVADGMSTPLAQEEYERMYTTLTGDKSGKKPINATLATHWARVVEIVNAAERFHQLINDPEITDPNVHTIPTKAPTEGVGIVEAPRGILTHHYITDEKGIVKKANLIVGTTNNHAPISMSAKKAAKALIKGQKAEVPEKLLNMVEMAFRAYDPCYGCATHALPGKMPLIIDVYDNNGNKLDQYRRD